MSAFKTPHKEEDVSDAFRTLVFMGYLEGPEVFYCPASEDEKPPVLSPGQNPKFWDWSQTDNTNSELPPIQSSSKVPVFNNRELSYTYLKRKLNGGSMRSDTPVFADKATVDHSANSHSNHAHGFHVAYADGHVRFEETKNEAVMTRLSARLHLGSYDPGLM